MAHCFLYNNLRNKIGDPKTMPNSKNKILYEIYEKIRNSPNLFSAEDLDIAIESMKLAQLDMKERERRRLQEQEVEENALYLPRDQRTLYPNVFKGNTEITAVVLNEGLKEIGEYAFAGCINLKKIIFPQNRIMLRKGCFQDCESLQEVYIPSVSNIGPCAFKNCIALEKVSLPANVSSIYSRAFENCCNLREVTFERDLSRHHCDIYSRAFHNCPSLETIEWPDHCMRY